MEIQDELRKLIKTIIKKEFNCDVPHQKIHFEFPADEKNGDLSTNIGLTRFKELNKNGLHKNPTEISKKISELLNKSLQNNRNIAKVEAVAPGFINIYMSKTYYIDQLLKSLTQEETYGSAKPDIRRKVLVEYSSPNIAKRFSVGHLRSTIVGQSIYNMYKFLGFEVVGESHLGDWGTQFGILIYAVEDKNVDVNTLTIEDFERLYVEYSAKIHDQPELRKKATDAFVRLEKGESEAKKIWKVAVDISLKEYERIYRILDVNIDYVYGESFYEEIMKDVIRIAMEKNVAEESEGAYVIRFKDLPTAVFIKRDGATTYLTRDLATIKFRRENPELRSDLYIYEVGADQKLHFQQVFKAAEMLGFGKETDYIHVAHGLLRLPEGKMSTRKGNTIKLEDLLNKAVQKAREQTKNEEVLKDKASAEQLANDIGIGAIKYNDLKYSPTTNYIFTWEEALSMNGNSGPYIQYTAARIYSLIGKGGINKDQLISYLTGSKPEGIYDIDFSEIEQLLLTKISRFNNAVETAALRNSPNLLALYLFELACIYNNFYNITPIIKADGENVKVIRLALSYGVLIVIRNGLSLLGIKTPKAM